jgi:hypothetical protein
MRTIAWLLLLYLEYSLIVFGVGVFACVGWWLRTNVAALTRSAR